MEATRSSETSVYNKPTGRNIPKNDILQQLVKLQKSPSQTSQMLTVRDESAVQSQAIPVEAYRVVRC
jgi:hypothetical protein